MHSATLNSLAMLQDETKNLTILKVTLLPLSFLFRHEKCLIFILEIFSSFSGKDLNVSSVSVVTRSNSVYQI